MTNDLPSNVASALASDQYTRLETSRVDAALRYLGVEHSQLKLFYERYEGPFWSEVVGCEILDLIDGDETVLSVTDVCRTTFGFARRYVVLTRLIAGQVVVLDVVCDMVYEVDFEGGVRQLAEGILSPRWQGFCAFLEDYFSY